MASELTTDAALRASLQAADTDKTRAVLKDADLFAFALAQFNNTVKLASGKPIDLAVGLANKAASTGKLVGKSSNAQGLVVGITAAQILVATASLASVGKSPVLAVSAVFAKKTALAFGLAGGDDKKAKCIAAFADVAAAAITVAIYIPAAGTGIGAIVLGGSLAQLTLSSFQAYQACFAEGR
ncbi:conserved hypothetical protein [Burkholderiales bacterium 8X]|nr:conserved hypothetical protein [Burkholderiales bacterium 8X]